MSSFGALEVVLQGADGDEESWSKAGLAVLFGVKAIATMPSARMLLMLYRNRAQPCYRSTFAQLFALTMISGTLHSVLHLFRLFLLLIGLHSPAVSFFSYLLSVFFYHLKLLLDALVSFQKLQLFYPHLGITVNAGNLIYWVASALVLSCIPVGVLAYFSEIKDGVFVIPSGIDNYFHRCSGGLTIAISLVFLIVLTIIYCNRYFKEDRLTRSATTTKTRKAILQIVLFTQCMNVVMGCCELFRGFLPRSKLLWNAFMVILTVSCVDDGPLIAVASKKYRRLMFPTRDPLASQQQNVALQRLPVLVTEV